MSDADCILHCVQCLPSRASRITSFVQCAPLFGRRRMSVGECTTAPAARLSCFRAHLTRHASRLLANNTRGVHPTPRPPSPYFQHSIKSWCPPHPYRVARKPLPPGASREKAGTPAGSGSCLVVKASACDQVDLRRRIRAKPPKAPISSRPPAGSGIGAIVPPRRSSRITMSSWLSSAPPPASSKKIRTL
jgi:hypothetical protein